jgi:hypothetical protein
VLQDTLSLTPEEVKWSYSIPAPGRKSRKFYLDGRITLENVKDSSQQSKIRDWIYNASEILEIDYNIRNSLKGIVFEVRQGYKSKDSKRQNADIANAAAAYTKGYLPCAAILSKQIDQDISLRYSAEKWMLLIGITRDASPYESFYVFMRDIIGYDLASLFERNKDVLKREVRIILESLLSAR